MKTLRNIISFLWKCWFTLITSILVILIGVFWVFPLAFSDKTFPFAYKGIRLWAILVFYGCGFRLDFIQTKKLDPNQTYISIANHTSVMDIMIMAIIHKKHPLVFVGKEELAQLPIFGAIYRRICITVDRSNLRSRTHVYTAVKEKINQGNSIMIFPEGEIPDDTNLILQRFKDGAFSLSISTQTPLALYSIKGIKEMFPESWIKGYPGKVKVKLLDIISTNHLSLADKNELKDYCFQQISAELTKHKK
ncbi:MAG: lysophospholipid acyltransferase family protein [Weeksellaceae bacterium]|nr:lysophospholipid acyltransferase family protein [Weeksellaceae bacterium]MDX9705144.1 lysophospholipid acyltransferase family protein [Weeksellaceae bacterium]